jgi:hypothetical protein
MSDMCNQAPHKSPSQNEDRKTVSSPSSEKCPDDLTLAAYIDAGLSPEETVLVEQHISHCPDCSLSVHAIREALSAPPEPVPPESLAKLQAFLLTAVAKEWAAKSPTSQTQPNSRTD